MKDEKRRGYRVKQVMTQDALKAYESRCHEEDAPACQARCPLHLDGRTFCAHMAAGNVDAARAQYIKEVPFPHLLSEFCHAPCRLSCRRKDVDAPINMQGLEQAAMRFGKDVKTIRRRSRSRKKGRVAIVGAGVAGCTAAHTLAAKGFTVDVFEKTERAGGVLAERDDMAAAWQADFNSLLENDAIVFHYNQEVKTNFIEPSDEYGAVFVTTSVLDDWGLPPAQALSFQVQDHIFSMPAYPLPDAFVDVVATARRAAWSMDRYMQGAGVSLTTGRDGEGPYETQLVTEIDGVMPCAAPPEAPFHPEESRAEAGRCLQCHCLICQRGCAYLQAYQTYPKRLMRTVYNNISIVAGNRTANQLINSCALCDQCHALCPTDIDVVQVIRSARENMVETHKMPPSAHEFALLDMAFSRSSAYRLVRSDVDTDQPAYVFFPGCQLGALAPELVEKTYQDLRTRLHGGVGLMLDCCGAIADWAGLVDVYHQTLADVREDLRSLGDPQVIVACPTCYRNFSQQWPDVTFIGIWDVLPDESEQATKSFTLQEPCTLRHEPELMAHIRRLIGEHGIDFKLSRYAGEVTACCGYGGLVKYANPEVASQFAQNIVPENGASLTLCINCRDQILRQGGEARHLLECFFGEQSLQPPTLGARRQNRQALKKQLLKTIWGEDMTIPSFNCAIQLDEGVQEKMEARWIMVQDVQEVIQEAEAEKLVIVDAKTGHCFAYRRIGKVTFWVEYSRLDEGFLVHDAYSHRMTIEEV